MFISKVTDNLNGCCREQSKGKITCPSCHENAKGVLSKTLYNLLTDMCKEKLDCLEGFYYCKTASCDVVYFNMDRVLKQEDVSVGVGLKEGMSPAIVCYCFLWSKEKIAEEIKSTGSSTALKDIKNKMKHIGCSCETLNPSGGCCLADVAHTIKEFNETI